MALSNHFDEGIEFFVFIHQYSEPKYYDKELFKMFLITKKQ